MRAGRVIRILVAAAIVGVGFGAVASSASANFHLMKVRAVFLGAEVMDDFSFIELQMTADGQNLTAGHNVTIHNAGGTVTTTIPLVNVPNGQNQRTILIGDTGTTGPPDVIKAGLRNDLAANLAGGAVCFDTVDCFSWGAFVGNVTPLPSSAGTPDDGLSQNMVNARGIGAGCATALDDADDTNNSQADFNPVIGFPLRNNAGVPTEVPCTPPATTSPTPSTPAPAKKAKKCKKAKKKGTTGPSPKSAEAAAKKKGGCKTKKKGKKAVTQP